jgi:hypothetical protein
MRFKTGKLVIFIYNFIPYTQQFTTVSYFFV